MILAADAAAIGRAAALLRAGELVAFPTETVYGLGADASNPHAVRGIFDAKGRPADHPVIVHLQNAARMKDWARDVPESARRLATAFWPGPLTLILPRDPRVPDMVTGGQDSVGLRVPSHPVAQALLAAFGGGIAAPSANRFGRISPTRAAHVAEDLGSRVSLILDGGASQVGIESTIVACLEGPVMLLRPGGISVEAIAEVLGYWPAAPDRAVPRASGTLASHYAPRTPAKLVAAGDLVDVLAQERDRRVAVLARGVPRPDDHRGAWITAPDDVEMYAHALYANLRLLDAAGVDVIVIEAPPAGTSWLAVGDRLARATAAEADDDDRD